MRNGLFSFAYPSGKDKMNSFMSWVGGKKALREEIQSLKKQFEINKKELDGLQNDPDVVEEVARMHLFMRKADEDVYVIE